MLRHLRSFIIGFALFGLIGALALFGAGGDSHPFGPKAAAAQGGGGGGGNGGGNAGGNSQGATASALGGLNAAHASATGRANAAPNSMVGQIATYEDAVLSGEDPAAAAEASFGEALTDAVIGAVNALLGIDSEDPGGGDPGDSPGGGGGSGGGGNSGGGPVVLHGEGVN